MYQRCPRIVWGHMLFRWPQLREYLQNSKVEASPDTRVRLSRLRSRRIDAVPADGSVLLDAMAVLQSTVVVPDTHGELAGNIFARILAKGGGGGGGDRLRAKNLISFRVQFFLGEKYAVRSSFPSLYVSPATVKVEKNFSAPAPPPPPLG